MKDGGLLSPLGLPHPMPNLEGDKRDVHDHNPHAPEEAKHDRGKDTPAVVMYEGVDHGNFIGPVEKVAEDVLSTPMRGQRRDSSGKYESEKTENQG